MRKLEGGQTICPHCGFDNGKRHNSKKYLPEGTVLKGRYLIGKKAKRDTVGVTYPALDMLFDVRVSVKEFLPYDFCRRDETTAQVIPCIINPDLSEKPFEKGLECFLSECRELGRLSSPSFLHIRDFFRENGTVYCVRDHIDAPTLNNELRLCGGQMPWERVVGLFLPFIAEIGKLHKNHFLLRDIRPEYFQVIPENNGESERLIFTDCGGYTRSFLEENRKGPHYIQPPYFPIEHYSSKIQQGPYTDVYLVCAVMYTLITGKKPPCAPDRWLYLDHADYSTGSLNTFASFGVRTPANIENAIRHGLALRPEDRPQSMGRLWDELSGNRAPQITEPPDMIEPEYSFTAEKPKDMNLRKKGLDKGWVILIVLWLVVLTAIMLLLLLRVRL